MIKLIIFCLFISLYSFISHSNELEILKDMPGNGVAIKDHYKVKVNYKGTLENGIEFDSSYKRNKPFIFQIEEDETLNEPDAEETNSE